MAQNCLITELLRELVCALDRAEAIPEEAVEAHARASRFLEAFHFRGVSDLPCSPKR